MLMGFALFGMNITYPFVVSQTEEIIKSMEEQTIIHAPFGIVRQEVPQEQPEVQEKEKTEEKTEEEQEAPQVKQEQNNPSSAPQYSYNGQILSPSTGRVSTIDGKGTESYYNLDMSGVVSIMRAQGYSESEYPYWVREDGCKMLGNYVMCAANFSIYPRGSVVQLTLGQGLSLIHISEPTRP